MNGFGRRRADCAVLIAIVFWGCLASASAPAAPVDLPEPGLVADPETAEGRALVAAFAAGRFAKAAQSADALVAAARRGNDTAALVAALGNRGAVRYHAQDWLSAAADFEAAAERLRAAGNGRDPRLVPLLLGLGASAYRAADYRRAATALAQAAFVSRTRSGPAGREQLRGYEALIAARTGLGEYEAAARRQRMRLSVLARAGGAGDPDHVDALGRAADWFRRAGRYQQARALYRERLDYLAARLGKDDPALVPVLRDIAATYADGNADGLRGLDALDRALRIQRRAGDAPPAGLAETRLSLGDFYLRYGASRRAASEYRRAYRILAEAGDEDGLARLARPQPIHWPPLGDDAPVPLQPVPVRLEVDRDGRVRNVEIADAARLAPGAGAILRGSVKRALFRPRITADGVVASQGVTYRYGFRTRFEPSGATETRG